jgi:hypothetical protein
MTGSPVIDHGTVCGCVGTEGNPKRLYPDRKTARVVRRRHMRGGGTHMSVYPCPEGAPGFHIGRLDPAIVAGVRTRADRYGT